jgi:hypothetical protein
MENIGTEDVAKSLYNWFVLDLGPLSVLSVASAHAAQPALISALLTSTTPMYVIIDAVTVQGRLDSQENLVYSKRNN